MASQKQQYTILYGRLSQEDERAGESNSIQHQRELLEKYAQTGYNLSSRNLIWDIGRVGFVVSHNGVNDGDHLPAGVAHGRHVGLPFISFFLKIKLQRRIVEHRR